jgi:hypothetical protein
MQLNDWEHVPRGTVCALVKKILKEIEGKKQCENYSKDVL